MEDPHAAPAEAEPPAELPLDAMAAALTGEPGFALLDSFVDPAAVVRLRACADLRAIRGEFRPAAIGAAKVRRAEVRGDDTCWLSEPLFPAERAVLARLERLRLGLNERLLLGLFDVEAHYARYPPGAGYAAHVDQPEGSTARRLTFVLYMNPDWNAAAGGELRMYRDGRPVADIEPRGGRLVCFLTEGTLHEVLPARRARWSLTGWFRCRDL